MNRVLNPDYVRDVRRSFESHAVTRMIRATMPLVEVGRVEVHVPHWAGIEQHSGFIHGGIVAMIVESVANHAAMTLVDSSRTVATVEMKLGFVSPVAGDRLIARGHVTRSGGTAITTEVDVFTIIKSEEHLCATAELIAMVVEHIAAVDT